MLWCCKLTHSHHRRTHTFPKALLSRGDSCVRSYKASLSQRVSWFLRVQKPARRFHRSAAAGSHQSRKKTQVTHSCLKYGKRNPALGLIHSLCVCHNLLQTPQSAFGPTSNMINHMQIGVQISFDLLRWRRDNGGGSFSHLSNNHNSLIVKHKGVDTSRYMSKENRSLMF